MAAWPGSALYECFSVVLVFGMWAALFTNYWKSALGRLRRIYFMAVALRFLVNPL